MAFDHLSVQFDWFNQCDDGTVFSACASFYKVDLTGQTEPAVGATAPTQGPLSVLVDRLIYQPATPVSLSAAKAFFNSQLASVNAATGVGANAINFILLT